MKHTDPAESMIELPAAEDLRAKLASFGISDDSRIVVYFGAEGVFPLATRIAYTLDYVGLGDRTSILNGGLPAWTRAGKAVTAETPTVTPGKLTARPAKNLVAEAVLVKSVG